MKRYSRLKNLRVASPCPVSWAEMQGDDKVRFCNLCSLNVYNVSAMTSEEAEQLLLSANGRLCVRFYRRADGRVMTQDCPLGLAKVRQKVVGYAGALATCILGLLLLPTKLSSSQDYSQGDVTVSSAEAYRPAARPRRMPVLGYVAPADGEYTVGESVAPEVVGRTNPAWKYDPGTH